jgi:hypothetical protein
MLDPSIIDFAKNLELGSKSLRMYSETHPRSQLVLRETYDSISRLLANRESITLSVFHENLLCDGEIVDKGSLVLTRLARELAARNIDTVKIIRGLTLEELLVFLRHLILTPQQLREIGGIEKVFDDHKIQTIQVNKVKYGIIDGDEVSGFDQATLGEMLLIVQTLLSGTAEVDEVAANIEQSLASNISVDPGAVLLHLFQSMLAHEREVPADPLNTEPLKQKFAQLYESFTPAMQRKLLLTSILSEKQDAAFYNHLNPEEFERSVLSLLDQELPEKQLNALVSRLQQDPAMKLSEHVIERIRSKRVVQQEVSSAPPSIAAELLKKQFLTGADLGKIPDAIQELIAKESLSEADQLSKRVFSILTTGQPEQKKAAIEALPAVIQSLSRHEKWKNVEFSLSFLISTCYRKETSEEVLSAYVPFLLSTFRKHYESQNWSSCQDSLSTIRAQTDRRDNIKQEFAGHWIRIADIFIDHLREGWPGVEIVIEGFKITGANGLSYLIDLLADEEDQKVRSRLISAIVSFPTDVVSAELERRMNDPRWFVVRNMVTIVSKLHSGEIPQYLQAAAVHPDPRVPKELIKILYKGSAKSQLPFILLLMQHPDKNVRIQAVHLVTMQSATGAVSGLVKILESAAAAETDLRTASLQALLKLRSVEGLVPAATLLERKPSSKTELPERNAAVRLLGELAREQMRPILEKMAQSDPYPETRSIAASYL